MCRQYGDHGLLTSAHLDLLIQDIKTSTGKINSYEIIS